MKLILIPYFPAISAIPLSFLEPSKYLVSIFFKCIESNITGTSDGFRQLLIYLILNLECNTSFLQIDGWPKQSYLVSCLFKSFCHENDFRICVIIEATDIEFMIPKYIHMFFHCRLYNHNQSLRILIQF
jgi:hypothetical protein